MTATFRLQPGELNDSFFENLRTMFRDRAVELVVHDVEGESEFPPENPSGLAEAKRRLEAYDRGEIASVDAHDAMARVRKLRAR